MKSTVKVLLAAFAVMVVLASCKKKDPTKTEILTSHKWAPSSSITSYSDSSTTHDNRLGLGTCGLDGYIEFRIREDDQREIFFYTESKCVDNPNEPDIASWGAWDLDQDEAYIKIGGQWHKISTLDGSSLVYTDVSVQNIYHNGITSEHTVTTTTTYKTK